MRSFSTWTRGKLLSTNDLGLLTVKRKMTLSDETETEIRTLGTVHIFVQVDTHSEQYRALLIFQLQSHHLRSYYHTYCQDKLLQVF